MARDHERYAEDLAPYLLGALPALDAGALEKHLRACGECQRELAELRPSADALARSVEQLEAPPSLRTRLLEKVAAEGDEAGADAPPAAAGAYPATAEPASRSRLRSARALLARLRPGPMLRPRPALAVLAVGLLVAGAGVAGWSLGAAGAEERRTLAATVDRDRLPGARGWLTMASDGDEPVLHLDGLRDLGPERSYEIWFQRDGELAPGPLFSPTADGAAVTGIPGETEDIEAVFVTRERAGGARTPSETPIVSVPIPS